MNNLKKTLLMMISSLMILTGCSSQSVSTGFIENEGLTVGEIYRQTTDEANDELSFSKLSNRKVNFSVQNVKGKKGFNRIDNPSIPLFIYSHVAKIGDEEVVKPGMHTEFFLYKQNRYAYSWERY